MFIKHPTIKLIIWNIVLFSFFLFASGLPEPFVDRTYKLRDSREDLYDGILNTIFPVFFVFLYNVSGKSGSIKNIVLPLLDDVLHNMVTWMIPLIVSLIIDRRMMAIKVFSILNMGLHVAFTLLAIIHWKRVVDYEKYGIFVAITLFMIFFSSIVTPIFWMSYIIKRKEGFGFTFILFLILFGLCLVSCMLAVILGLLSHYFKRINDKINVPKIITVLCIICFYFPNIFQTFIIIMRWPISLYVSKTFIFLLVLSITRGLAYFVDKVPENFLATSTSVTQCSIKAFTMDDSHEIFLRKKTLSTEEMQTEIDDLQTKIKEMKISMDEVKKNRPKDENV